MIASYTKKCAVYFQKLTSRIRRGIITPCTPNTPLRIPHDFGVLIWSLYVRTDSFRDNMPDSQPEARMVEMEAADTLDVTPESLIEYFSVSPYSWEITEVKGKTVKHKVPNDLPTPAGFCAKMGISERTLSDLVAKDPQWQAASEIASAKMKYFIQINGITKGVWEQTFASLLAKNEIGYTEKAEVRQVGLTHEEALRELVRQELLASQPLETPLPVIEHLSEARVV